LDGGDGEFKGLEIEPSQYTRNGVPLMTLKNICNATTARVIAPFYRAANEALVWATIKMAV
jgi:hypothetical protein